MLRTIAAGVAILFFVTPLHANREHAHVRPADPSIRGLIERGVEQSSTLRDLVERLQYTDVVVFVDFDPQLPRDLAGGLRFITRAGSLRLLRVSLSRALGVSQRVQTLGHELQHALEVADAPEIVDDASLNAFYRRKGGASNAHDRFDTGAAQHAGEQVGSDLASSSRGGRPNTAPRSPLYR